jgi:hypothetical protein
MDKREGISPQYAQILIAEYGGTYDTDTSTWYPPSSTGSGGGGSSSDSGSWYQNLISNGGSILSGFGNLFSGLNGTPNNPVTNINNPDTKSASNKTAIVIGVGAGVLVLAMVLYFVLKKKK